MAGRLDTADVVVIGSGILGASAAYHLAEAGAGKVALVEREPALGTQTTAAGASFVAYWAGELETRLATYGMTFYELLQQREGADLGIRQVGLLFPALSESGLELLRTQYARERSYAPARMVGADEACRLSPLLARGAFLGGLYQPDAHKVDAERVIQALGHQLEARGVGVRCGVEVRRIAVDHGADTGVETATRTIATRRVIVAAGAATRALAKRNGVDVAAIPLPESRFVTEPLAAVYPGQPMMLFFERDLLYLREHLGGLLVGAIEREIGDASRVPLDEPPRTADLSLHAVARHASRGSVAAGRRGALPGTSSTGGWIGAGSVWHHGISSSPRMRSR